MDMSDGTPAEPGALVRSLGLAELTLAGLGVILGAGVYALGLTGGFGADLAAGGLVSLRLSAVGTTIGYVFNSRNFGTVGARPALTITAVPGPGVGAVMAAAGLLRRRRR